MIRLGSHVLLLGILLFALFVTGCPSIDREPEEAPHDSTDTYDLTFRQPQFPQNRTLDTVMAIDLDGSGRAEYIVTSLSQDIGFLPSGARADLLQVYQFDTDARDYRLVLVDSMNWATGYDVQDVTGDNRPELVVNVLSGGNDPVASSGLNIYSGTTGSIGAIFRSDTGMPEIKTIDQIPAQTIVTYSEFWPEMLSHAEAVVYADDLLVFRKGSFQSIRTEHSEYFQSLADEQLEIYRQVRQQLTIGEGKNLDSIEVAQQVFAPVALVLLNLQRANATFAFRSFWDSERVFLEQRLPQTQFTALSEIYAQSFAQ